MKRLLICCMCLGLCIGYAKKMDTKEYMAKKIESMERLCSKERSDECYNVGLLYEEGSKKQDFIRAAEYYKKACDWGSVQGCVKIGFLHTEGKGVSKDDKKASEYYKKACDKQEAFGCFVLGKLYYGGKGVPKDIKKAKMYFNKACSLGNQLGCDEENAL